MKKYQVMIWNNRLGIQDKHTVEALTLSRACTIALREYAEQDVSEGVVRAVSARELWLPVKERSEP